MTHVKVLRGDVTGVQADVLMTSINPGRAWYGGIDGAIQRRAGNVFHAQAANRRTLDDGDLVFATAAPHGGRFASVLFIVDDLQQPLRQLILAGLREIERRQLRSVSLPTIRTGIAGTQRSAIEAAVNEIILAVREFVASEPQHLNEINVVVYDDSTSEQQLIDGLSH